MNIQALVIRGILMVALSLGLTVAMVHRANTQARVSVAAAPMARAPLGQPAPVVLPTISVRPTAADIAAALEGEDDPGTAAFIETADMETLGSGSALPRLHLDMPYYSFGKTLPRVSKE